MSGTRALIIAGGVALVGLAVGFALNPSSSPTSGTISTSTRTHPVHKPRTPVKTPDLMGQSPQSARDEAAGADLRVRFAPTHYDCPGPPGGEVVWQNPPPGFRGFRGEWIDAGTSVQVSCGQHHLALRPCDPGQLSLSTDGADSAYAGTAGWISLLVEISNRGDSPCRINSTLTLAVERSGALDSSIRGNPARLQVRWGLEPQRRNLNILRIEWLWPSWCGSRGSVQLVGTLGGQTATSDSHSPTCMDEQAQPYLRGANVSTNGLP